MLQLVIREVISGAGQPRPHKQLCTVATRLIIQQVLVCIISYKGAGDGFYRAGDAKNNLRGYFADEAMYGERTSNRGLAITDYGVRAVWSLW